MLGNVHRYFHLFDGEVNNLYYKCFPVKAEFISTKRLCKLWMSSVLFNSIKHKSSYFKLYKQGIISQNVNNTY